MASCYQNENGSQTSKKIADSSNLQGLENVVELPRGNEKEILRFDRDDSDRISSSSGVVVKETSDLTRLQDEDFRSRLKDEHRSMENQFGDVPIDVNKDDPLRHRDDRQGRVNLSIRYDDEEKKLFVQLLDAQGLIRPEQFAVPEMFLQFTLVGPNQNDFEPEKHQRIVGENAPTNCKEPMTFDIALDKAIEQNLFLRVFNDTDPSAPTDREVNDHRYLSEIHRFV